VENYCTRFGFTDMWTLSGTKSLERKTEIKMRETGWEILSRRKKTVTGV
jgi:hypothetical protein